MRIFLTGSTGFIGSAIVPELIRAGHQVLGLTRSEAGAKALAAAGAQAHRGNIEDLNSLREGAAACEAVIHTAFDHDMSRFAENCQKDRRVIEALGSALEGSTRPLLITSSTTMGSAEPGQPADEEHFNPDSPNPRIASELAARDLLQRGVNVSVVRLSQIHDRIKQGFITELIGIARKQGVSAYVSDGLNPWSAAALSDTARLYRLAAEKRQAGARYHATSEGAIELRAIAEAIAQRLRLPLVSVSMAEAKDHFGWIAPFVSKNMSASSAKTQATLGWTPSGPGLLEDIANLQDA